MTRMPALTDRTGHAHDSPATPCPSPERKESVAETMGDRIHTIDYASSRTGPFTPLQLSFTEGLSFSEEWLELTRDVKLASKSAEIE